MRRLLYVTLLSLLLLPLTAVGQEMPDSLSAEAPSASLIVTRHRNTYMVGDVQMNKQAYRGYLKNTCPEAYRQFDRGYKTAMAGWGLFSAGPVLIGVCTPLWVCASYGYNPLHSEAYERRRQADCYSNLTLSCLGGASLISGIVCLSVGYHQMHRTTGNLNCDATTYWTFEKRPNEIGLACHF